MDKSLDLLNACAGLFGACGVAAAAGAAHVAGGEHLHSVALILLVHAAALLGLTSRAREGAREAAPGAWLRLTAAVALGLGAALFSSDVTLLTLRGARLFPMAAPTGGSIMILGWLTVFAAGVADMARRYR